MTQLIETIKALSKIAGYKINVQKLLAFIYKKLLVRGNNNRENTIYNSIRSHDLLCADS